MKRKILFVVSFNMFLYGIISLFLINFNYGLNSKFIDLLIAVLAIFDFSILVITFYKKVLVKKDITKYLLITPIIYMVFSFLYFLSINNIIANFILFKFLFYISLILFLVIYSSIFYYFIENKKIKIIVNMLISLLVIIFISLLIVLISSYFDIPKLLLIISNYLSITSLFLLMIFLILLIIKNLFLIRK